MSAFRLHAKRTVRNDRRLRTSFARPFLIHRRNLLCVGARAYSLSCVICLCCIFPGRATRSPPISIFRREGDVCRGELSGFPFAHRVSEANGANTHLPTASVAQKKTLTKSSRSLFCVGAFLSSRAATSQVLSAQVSLTAVFGMGTGVPSPPSAPTMSGSYPEN